MTASDASFMPQQGAEREMEDSQTIRLKMLLFRSRHRGCKETDIILGRFAEAQLKNLDQGQLDRFELLLDADDADLFAWVAGNRTPPPPFDTDVLVLIKNFKRQV